MGLLETLWSCANPFRVVYHYYRNAYFFQYFIAFFVCAFLDLDAFVYGLRATFRTFPALSTSLLFHSFHRMFVFVQDMFFVSLKIRKRNNNNIDKKTAVPNAKSQRQEDHHTAMAYTIFTL